MKEIESCLGELYHCFHCHLCYVANWHRLDDWKTICPSYAYFGFEAYSASGRIEIARALIEGEIKKPTSRLLQSVFSCTSCGACYEQCKGLTGFKLNHVELFEDLKSKLVKLGWGPLVKHKEFSESICKNHNPYHEPHEKRFAWLNGKSKNLSLKSNVETLYFVGCTSSYRRKEIAKATVNILEKADVNFGFLNSDEWCCGSPLLRTGQTETAYELAKHNVEAINKSRAKNVIFSCAGCYKTFKKDYPKILGKELNFEVLHVTEYLNQLFDGEKLKIKNKITKTITYHDPCHLGRRAGVYEPPRKLLENATNKNFVEMKRNKNDSWCCGSGGGVKSAYPDFALWAAKERMLETKETGAKVLSSSCPFCKHNFIDALQKYSDEFKIEVKDICEILMEVI